MLLLLRLLLGCSKVAEVGEILDVDGPSHHLSAATYSTATGKVEARGQGLLHRPRAVERRGLLLLRLVAAANGIAGMTWLRGHCPPGLRDRTNRRAVERELAVVPIGPISISGLIRSLSGLC